MSLAAEIQTELERAEAARTAGNAGRARVCARRAAGMAAGDFLTRHQVWPFNTAQGEFHKSSVYETLQLLASFPSLAPDLKQAAIHMTMRVDEEFHLPLGIDLVDEAYKIIRGLK